MTPRLPPPPQPDAHALARGQARLLADLSRIQPESAADSQAMATEADVPHAPTPTEPLEATHAPWHGPQAAWEAASAEPPATRRYRFAEVFARGGLGAVRRAEDRKLGRTIAIKELLRFDAAAVQRFAREAAITARLQHPGIIPLHDLGRDELGRPFLCMKLVEGGSLEQRIAACQGLPARLALLPQVIAAADAVAYAHSHRVIHRDLKPANILVGEFGEAVVIDWGLAKDLSQGTDPDPEPGAPDTISDVTAAGSLLGTIRYMPPEQARGEAVDARSDVYALGAVLYHLLAGAPPFADLRSAELLHAVLAGRPEPLLTNTPAAPRALAAIVSRAMEREPAARYPSAEAFAEDLRRFVAGRLVGAHDYSPAELGRLWLRRHRGVASVAAASLVTLTALAGLAFVRVDAERDRAEAALISAESERSTAESARSLAEQRADEARSARTLADRSADQLRLQQARSNLVSDPGAAIRMLAELNEDPGNDAPARLLALAAQARGLPGLILHGPRSFLLDVQVLADGTILAREHSGPVWRWSPGAAQGEQLADTGVFAVAPGGQHWALVADTSVTLHRHGELARTIPVPNIRGPIWLRWQLSADARTLVGAGHIASIPAQIIDLSQGTSESLPGPGAPPAIATSVFPTPAPDGRVIAALQQRERLHLWNRDTGELRSIRLPGRSTSTPSFAPDGRTVIVHCEGDRVLVALPDGATRIVPARFAAIAGAHLVLLGPDPGGFSMWAEPLAGGATLWTRPLPERADPEAYEPLRTGDGELVRLHLGRRWEIVDARTGAVRHARPGDDHTQLWLGRGPQVLATVAADDAVHDLATVDLASSAWTQPIPATTGHLERVALASNGRFAARQRQRDHQLERLDLEHGLVTPLPAGCGPFTAATIPNLHVADDGRVLLGDTSGHACLWTADAVHPLTLPSERIHGLDFAPDGRGFAIALLSDDVLRYDHPGAEPERFTGHGLRHSPDGATALLFTAPHPRLLPNGRAPIDLDLTLADPDRVAFAPDSRSVALYRDGAVHLFNTRDGQLARRLSAPPPIDRTLGGQGLRFAPSGQALAFADGDRIYRWSLAGPDAPATLDRIRAYDLAFTPDERALIVLDEHGNLLLVDPVARVQAPLRDETGAGSQPRLTATIDGVLLHTASGEALQWRDTLPTDPDALRQWLRSTVLRSDRP